MRIIAGTHRSRRILSPPDTAPTRPMPDRVKQALFDRLVNWEVMGGMVADIFAGTGSLGLEALSREAEHCVFIERDRSARQMLKENLATLSLTDQATVLAVDALIPTWTTMLPGGRDAMLRVSFCDPPYAMAADEAGMRRLIALGEAICRVTEPGGVYMLRTEKFKDGTEPHPIDGFMGPESHVYGGMALHFYVKPLANDNEASEAGEAGEASEK